MFQLNPYYTMGALLLLMGGCSITNSIMTEDRLARLPKLTCEQLIKNGAPADGQVMLTDVKLCSKGYVATRFDGDLELFIPAYPAGLAQEPAPPELGFLFQVWGDEEWHRIRDDPAPLQFNCWATWKAKVVDFCRGPGEIEKWVKDGLDGKYAGMHLDKVWVLSLGHGNTPTAERVKSAWQYGIGELVLGVAMLGLGVYLDWRKKGKGATVSVPRNGAGDEH